MVSRSTLRMKFWEGWNCATDAVWKALAEQLPASSLTPDQQQLRNAVIDYLRQLLPDPALLKSKPTNAELAAKYSISLRTITNWRQAGCPFDGSQWAVLRWVTGRRIIPTSFRAKYAHQLARRKERDHWRGSADSASQLLNRVKEAKRAGQL